MKFDLKNILLGVVIGTIGTASVFLLIGDVDIQTDFQFGEKLNQDPRINLSTIHGAKGGECDNVVLLTDLTENTQKGYDKNPDDEERLFYVGATRTKETLHIVRPRDMYKGYKI